MSDNINVTRGCGIFEEDENNTQKCSSHSCNKLNVYNWLEKLPESSSTDNEIVEVRFKNTRKAFFRNVNKLRLETGDIVAVEASPGHDIGIVSLTGELVHRQMFKYGVEPDEEFKKVYRKAKLVDIEKWKTAIEIEDKVMLKTRQIADELKLDMKIGDVEYQGDGTKAIFYYIADERVDFRELIKILAEEFRIRIEMKQIGARQEAGRIGGIASCGRELCCTTWITSFVSVTTNSARYQELALNPQKLAGQCGKLKCCLNYELDAYMDAQSDFPATNIELLTEDGTAYHQKTDIFKGIMWYSFDQNSAINITPVPVERVKKIIKLNNEGKKVSKLIELNLNNEDINTEPVSEYQNSAGQESLTRFDNKTKKKKNPRNKRKRNKSINNNNKNNKQVNKKITVQKRNQKTNTNKNNNPKRKS